MTVRDCDSVRSAMIVRMAALTANQLVVELAIEALDRREWPTTETEIKVARASLFAAQAIARGLIADGREHEVQEIREFISTIVPDPDPDSDSEDAESDQASKPVDHTEDSSS